MKLLDDKGVSYILKWEQTLANSIREPGGEEKKLKGFV